MSVGSAKKEIRKLDEKYISDVQIIARREFESVVKPWLIKKGYTFGSGMGSWAVWDGEFYISRDMLPNFILDILEISVLEQDLGSLMPNYD